MVQVNNSNYLIKGKKYFLCIHITLIFHFFNFQLYGIEVLGDMKHLTKSRSENFRDKRQANVNNMTFTVRFRIKNINECTLCQPNIFDNIKQYEEIKQMLMTIVLVCMIETVKQTSSKSMLNTRSLTPTAFF